MDSQILVALALFPSSAASAPPWVTLVSFCFSVALNEGISSADFSSSGFCCWPHAEHIILRLGTERSELCWFLQGKHLGEFTYFILLFYAGVVSFAIIINFIPEPSFALGDVDNKKKDDEESGKDLMKKHCRQVLFSGIITTVGISLHNFPEGMAVFLGSVKGLRVGINLALAIALHNIPEWGVLVVGVDWMCFLHWLIMRQSVLLITVSAGKTVVGG